LGPYLPEAILNHSHLSYGVAKYHLGPVAAAYL